MQMNDSNSMADVLIHRQMFQFKAIAPATNAFSKRGNDTQKVRKNWNVFF